MINLAQYQQEFSKFIRKNANKKYHTKNLPQKNLSIYAQLVFNNINSALQACFPICYAISAEILWDNLVHAFIDEFKCEEALYRDIPEQFLVWLQQDKHITKLIKSLPDFFISFAHYEWLEMAIAISPDNKYIHNIYPIDDIKYCLSSDNIYVFSDAWTIVDYYYDMHLINEKYQPKTKKLSSQYYLIFRNDKGQVKFNILSLISVNILALLTNKSLSIKQSLEEILTQNPELNKDDLLATSEELIKVLYEQGMILGVK